MYIQQFASSGNAIQLQSVFDQVFSTAGQYIWPFRFFSSIHFTFHIFLQCFALFIQLSLYLFSNHLLFFKWCLFTLFTPFRFLNSVQIPSLDLSHLTFAFSENEFSSYIMRQLIPLKWMSSWKLRMCLIIFCLTTYRLTHRAEQSIEDDAGCQCKRYDPRGS